MKRRPSLAQTGFSTIELAVVVAIGLVMAATAVFQIMPALRNAKVDAGIQTALGRVRRARERAVDERKVYRVSFVAPRTITTERQVIDALGNRTYQAVESVDMPVELQFTIVTGIPTGSAGTPDNMGTGGAAIDFDVDFGGGQTQMYFQPDGRVLDAANRLNSGVAYIARPADLMSSRAITVLGATGRVKGWRLVAVGSTKRWKQ